MLASSEASARWASASDLNMATPAGAQGIFCCIKPPQTQYVMSAGWLLPWPAATDFITPHHA